MNYSYCVVVQKKDDLYKMFVPDLPIDVVSHQNPFKAERMIQKSLNEYIQHMIYHTQDFNYKPTKLKEIEMLLKADEQITMIEVSI